MAFWRTQKSGGSAKRLCSLRLAKLYSNLSLISAEPLLSPMVSFTGHRLVMRLLQSTRSQRQAGGTLSAQSFYSIRV
jgi:hypothetical protein